MKVGIIGSRTFDNYGLMLYYINTVLGFGEEITIVSGGARGADSLAKRLAESHNYKYIEFPADWDTYGKSAGFKRNSLIVGNSDFIIAFWDGISKGTKDTIDKARIAKKPTLIVYDKE